MIVVLATAAGIVFYAGMCGLGVTSLVALAALCRYPRLWLSSLGVLATAAGIVFYIPVRTVFHTPSSFDPVGDPFGIFAECLVVATYVGLLHLGLFLVLIGSVVEERKRRASVTSPEDEAGPR
jgi:hypothetical protein